MYSGKLAVLLVSRVYSAGLSGTKGIGLHRWTINSCHVDASDITIHSRSGCRKPLQMPRKLRLKCVGTSNVLTQAVLALENSTFLPKYVEIRRADSIESCKNAAARFASLLITPRYTPVT